LSTSDGQKDVTVTVRVDRSLKSKIDERPAINWSAVSRRAIRETIEGLEVMDEIASKNRMTEEDAEEIADRITESANERARAARETKTSSEEDRTAEGISPEQSFSGLAFETGRFPKDDKDDTSAGGDADE
jgi:hypothetical protein